MQGLIALSELDLLFGLILMVTISVSLAVMTVKTATVWNQQQLTIGFLVTALLTASWHFSLHDHAITSRILPFENLIIVGNWFLPFSAILGGIAFRSTQGSFWSKFKMPFLLMLTGLFATVYPLYGYEPMSDPCQSAEGHCLQTSRVTCSPACAVNLLKEKEIESTEAEMIRCCLCREGTYWQGVYRGLRQKTHNHAIDVEIFQGSVEELRAMTPGFLMLRVGIGHFQQCDSVYLTDYGWERGRYHSVILTRFLEVNGNESVEVIDPEIGVEHWSLQDLQVLYQGHGVRLVER